MQYRTPLLMRHYLKPHKYEEWQTLKTPMPSQKKLKKLEKLKEKGIEVSYPPAPWFTNNLEQIEQSKLERQKRIDEAQFSELLPELPADRSEGTGLDKVRV